MILTINQLQRVPSDELPFLGTVQIVDSKKNKIIAEAVFTPKDIKVEKKTYYAEIWATYAL